MLRGDPTLRALTHERLSREFLLKGTDARPWRDRSQTP